MCCNPTKTWISNTDSVWMDLVKSIIYDEVEENTRNSASYREELVSFSVVDESGEIGTVALKASPT